MSEMGCTAGLDVDWGREGGASEGVWVAGGGRVFAPELLIGAGGVVRGVDGVRWGAGVGVIKGCGTVLEVGSIVDGFRGRG